MNLDKFKVPTNKNKPILQNLSSESKANLLGILQKFKKGNLLEILKLFNILIGIEFLEDRETRNIKNLTLVQQFIDQHSQ